MSEDQPSDWELLERARSGDPDALQQLLTRHADKLATTVALTAAEDVRNEINVQDISQELFLILQQGIDSPELQQGVNNYDPGRETPVLTWLRGVTRNAVRAAARKLRQDKSRRTGARPGDGDEDDDNWLAAVALARGKSPSAEQQRADLAGVVEELRSRLPEDDWRLLVAHHVDGAPLAGLAAQFGLGSAAAVAMRLHRIRLRCRKLLGTDTGSDYV